MPPVSQELVRKYRQDIEFDTTLGETRLRLRSTWGLFSPREIDEGTELMLRYLNPEPDARGIDLGCGYGPIGLTLAKRAPRGNMVLLDKDFVAVDYSNQNAALNSITNAEARLSNGFSAITDDGYDLVVSNIPAKVGKEMLYLLLADAHRLLKPGGEITVVTVNGLRQFIKRQFNDIFGNYDKLKQGRVYTVARAVKSEC